MPSYVTHVLFAEESYALAFGRTVDEQWRPWLAAGAQGPDFFYSGRRRTPSGASWAERLHREGFGRFASLLAEAARRSRNEQSETAAPLTAYAAGFATHAVLDRAVHPFVHYFSGWADDGNPAGEDRRFCHPYMERCIDLIMLREKHGKSLEELEFPPGKPGLDEKLGVLVPALSSCISGAYPDAPDAKTVKAMTRNALQDDADFLLLIDPGNPRGVSMMMEMERRGDVPPRSLALLFPREEDIPDIDFMNDSARPWKDPRTGEAMGTSSFRELYEEALDAGAEAVKRASASDGVDEFLGNGDLDDPRGEEEGKRPPAFSDPLPIPPVIDAMYEAAASGA